MLIYEPLSINQNLFMNENSHLLQDQYQNKEQPYNMDAY
jgi:hypothetical protein